MAGAGDDEQVEALVGFDQRVDQTHRVRRMDVVVDLSVDEKQVALEVCRQFLGRRDVDLEAGLVILLLLVVLWCVLRLVERGGARAGARGLLLLLDRDLLEAVVPLRPVVVVDVVGGTVVVVVVVVVVEVVVVVVVEVVVVPNV